LPAESTAARVTGAVAVQGGPSRKQSAWKSFGGGSAVKLAKRASGTALPQAPSFA